MQRVIMYIKYIFKIAVYSMKYTKKIPETLLCLKFHHCLCVAEVNFSAS